MRISEGGAPDSVARWRAPIVLSRASPLGRREQLCVYGGSWRKPTTHEHLSCGVRIAQCQFVPSPKRMVRSRTSDLPSRTGRSTRLSHVQTFLSLIFSAPSSFVPNRVLHQPEFFGLPSSLRSKKSWKRTRQIRHNAWREFWPGFWPGFSSSADFSHVRQVQNF
jgi:hypothetical protein